MTKIIGLTGGIGSGKSTVAKYIASKNIPVYIADKEAKKIMRYPSVIKEVQSIFEESVIEGKSLDRKKIASIVFKHPEKLKLLNNIVHPRVKKHFTNWLQKKENYSYVVKEVAILFETGGDVACDAIILVTAPLEVKISRVMERDHCSREAVLNRMNNQMSDEDKIKKSDYVITNILLKDTQLQIDKILKKLDNL